MYSMTGPVPKKVVTIQDEVLTKAQVYNLLFQVYKDI